MKTLLAVMLLALPLGCATHIPLESKRIESISSLEVARSATPELQRISGDSTVGGALLLGGFGVQILSEAAGKELRERCGLEDFGEILVREFVARAPKEVPSWPQMRVLDAPVEAGYTAKDAYLLYFEPTAVMLYSWGPKGILTGAFVTLVAPGGEVVWKHAADYVQSRANRSRELEELEADSCRLLKEEMRYAAGLMAEELISDLKPAKP